MKKIFVSHTKKDREFCDAFDRIVADVGIPRFRTGFLEIEKPAWKTINREINNSIALFLLIGKELVRSQQSKEPGWRFTQNWISYEIGVASQKGIDVWVVCDYGVLINFPVPYINNYLISGLEEETPFKYVRGVLEKYKIGKKFSYPYLDPETYKDLGVVCPYNDCNLEFNLHNTLPPGYVINCPSCLREIKFKDGF